MKKKIDKANIPSLGELQEVAQLEGVEPIAFLFGPLLHLPGRIALDDLRVILICSLLKS